MLSEPSFRLTAEEDFVHGVGFNDGVLRFHGSGGRLFLAAITTVVCLGFGAVLLFAGSDMSIAGHLVKRESGPRVLGLMAVGYGLAAWIGEWRSGLVADANGVELRWWLRRQRYPWEKVAQVHLVEQREGRGRTSLGASGLSWRAQPVTVEVIGVLDLVDGLQVRLPGVRSPHKTQGFTMGAVTAAELKVAALERFRRHHRAEFEAPPVTSQPPGPTGRLQVAALGAMLGLLPWAVMCWAVESVIAPWVPVATVGGVIWRVARTRHTR